MTPPSISSLSILVGRALRCALTVSYATAILCACQNNSPRVESEPAPEATNINASTVAPTAESAIPETTAVQALTITSSAPVAAAEITEPSGRAKPGITPTAAKTPRPTLDNGKDVVAPKPASSAATAVAQAPKEPAPTIDKPCLSKTFEFSSVKSACEKGGVPNAKALMKSWTKKAKEKGEDYKCTSCHDNQRTYTNKSGAAADLRKLLNVIK